MFFLTVANGLATNLVEQHSSEAEWREEALRLERQGKRDQLEAIRRTILNMQPVPWQVMTPAVVTKLADEVLRSNVRGRRVMNLLLDYASFYNVPYLLSKLLEAGYTMARQPDVA